MDKHNNLDSRSVAELRARSYVDAVIIARDEGATISSSISAALKVLEPWPAASVVVVDCGSEDDTQQKASAFAVVIVSIPRDASLSPALARHVGLQFTGAEYVLFIDGDTIIKPAWLELGLRSLDNDKTLAGIAGACEGVEESNGAVVISDQYPNAEYDNPMHLSGSALYRVEALKNAGGFNPNMRAAEEIELGARLRKAGFRLRRTKESMSRHHKKRSAETTSELIRRARRGYPIGQGQLWRQAFTHDLPQPDAFSRIRNALLFMGLVGLGLSCAVLSLLVRRPEPVLVWTGTVLVLYLLFAIRSRNLRRPAYYFLEWLISGPMILAGMASYPKTVSEFEMPELRVQDLRETAEQSDPTDKHSIPGSIAH